MLNDSKVWGGVGYSNRGDEPEREHIRTPAPAALASSSLIINQPGDDVAAIRPS